MKATAISICSRGLSKIVTKSVKPLQLNSALGLTKTKSVYAKDALAGTTTAIVGGTSGIGLGSAKAIIEAGGEVIILSRTKANIDKVTKELGEKAHGYQMDASNEESVKKVFKEISEKHKLNHLVLSSGGKGPAGKFLEQDQKTLMKIWDQKYWCEVLPARYGAPLLPNSSKSSVTFVTGILNKKIYGHAGQKVAVNAALEALAMGLAVNLKPIRFNCISPDKIYNEEETARPAAYGHTEFSSTFADVAQDIIGLMLSKNTTGFTYNSDGGVTF